jgi:hypothetical protein
VAGQSNGEAASGQCVVASPQHWIGSRAVARLEPKTASSGLHAPASTTAGDSADRARSFRLLTSCVSVSCTACPFSSGLARAACSQRTHPNSKSGDDPSVWDPRRRCSLPGSSDNITRLDSHWGSLLGQACFSERSLMTFFPDNPSILPFFALHPAVSPTSHGLNAQF